MIMVMEGQIRCVMDREMKEREGSLWVEEGVQRTFVS